MRHLLEMALNEGRRRQSSQTGYLHYCYGALEEEKHLPIPIVENFLFALALLRSKVADNINEAKGILENLFYFQNREGPFGIGNFPIYIHEFPHCKDRFIGTQVALILCWILKHFHQILGPELRKRAETALFHTITHALQTHSEKNAPYFIAIKIAAIAKAGGELLGQDEFISQGTTLLQYLHTHPDSTSWYCSHTLGAMLSALSLALPSIKESSWKPFWEHLEHTWHAPTSTYAGPAFKEMQDRAEPQVTLYDLFLGYYSAHFSERALKPHPAHLEAVLIPLCTDPFDSPRYPVSMEGEVNGAKWHCYQTPAFAYSWIEGKMENPNKGFHALRLVYGDRQQAHTFVCQGGNNQSIHFTSHENQIEIFCDLGVVVEEGDREKNRELLFFLDVQKGMEFFVGEEKASTFILEEPISLRTPKCALTLKFELAKGEGKFLGHRMLGNRPSQINIKGIHRYDAYDWMLFMRTVRRSDHCQLKATIHIHPLPLPPSQ